MAIVSGTRDPGLQLFKGPQDQWKVSLFHIGTDCPVRQGITMLPRAVFLHPVQDPGFCPDDVSRLFSFTDMADHSGSAVNIVCSIDYFRPAFRMNDYLCPGICGPCRYHVSYRQPVMDYTISFPWV